MARSKSAAPPKPAALSQSQLITAVSKLDRRIDELQRFDPDLVTERWSSEVEALENKINTTLGDVLGVDSMEYSQYRVNSLDMGPVIIGETPYLSEVHQYLKRGVKRAIDQLTALKEILQERIEDAPSAPVSNQSVAEGAPRGTSRNVFVVHGHDDGLKETAARLLQKLELNAIILHEQANQGRTIIEKFEAHSDVDFAVVLFTGDDEGYRRGHPEEVKPRARQNVVLELGFFMAKLGRGKVCVLYAGSIEMPSDYSGVVFVPVDAAGAWRFLLAKEISASGIPVDLNKAL